MTEIFAYCDICIFRYVDMTTEEARDHLIKLLDPMETEAREMLAHMADCDDDDIQKMCVQALTQMHEEVDVGVGRFDDKGFDGRMIIWVDRPTYLYTRTDCKYED